MIRQPKALILYEKSGTVRDAFIDRGWDALSVDLQPSDSDKGRHWQGDVFDTVHQLLYEGQEFDLVIAHPPCTYLCSSGLHWNKRDPSRELKTQAAVRDIRDLWVLPFKRLAIENPVGCINTRLSNMPKPQYIQPYEFGHDASKKTGLWTRNLPPLLPTEYIDPRMVDGKRRWGNQTDSGQNRLAPSATRSDDRAKTYEGIARAMANQWGGYIEMKYKERV